MQLEPALSGSALIKTLRPSGSWSQRARVEAPKYSLPRGSNHCGGSDDSGTPATFGKSTERRFTLNLDV
jgi:hypothetical protein